MRKSTLFISATLTTFMLAMMAGVASAYKGVVQSGQILTTSQNSQVPSEVVEANDLPAAVGPQPASVNVSPEQAADMAAKVIGRTDLYSVEISDLNGVNAYLVTFSSGDLVYVGLDGQVLSIAKLPVTFINQPGSNGGGGNNGGDSGGNNGGGGGNHRSDEDEGHEDEHEEEHDDD